MRKIALCFAATMMLMGTTNVAVAAPCKDAKGKFTKCPPKASAPAIRCKDAKGKFAKCGTPGAKPV